MITLPWHPTRATDRAVYHDDTGCSEAAAIEQQYRRPGMGGRPPCEDCARVLDTAMVGGSPMPVPPLPETRERGCPTCHGQQIAQAGHVMASRALIKVEYRCAVCGTAFLLVRSAFT